MKRALLLSALLAPLLPHPAPAQDGSQVTPEHAAALQEQLKTWLQANLGIDTGARPPVTVAAAGDHYDVSYPLAATPGAPVMTGKMMSAGNGRWAVNDVTLPSPSTFHYQVPPTKKGNTTVPGGEATATLTLGQQKQSMLIDPTLATPSTLSATLGDLGITMQLPGVTQISHVDSGTSTSTITPVADDRLDIVSNTALQGYTIKMSGPNNTDPVTFAAAKASLDSTFKNVSRDRGLTFLRVVTRVNRTIRTTTPGGKTPAIDRDTRTALLSAFAGLLTAASFNQQLDGISITAGDKTGSLKQLVLSLSSAVDDGKLNARLPLVVDGLALPDLGFGGLAHLIPTRLTLTPTIANIPSDAATELVRKATEQQQPDPADINALFARGPVNAGIDDFHLDVAGSSFAGTVALTAASPAQFGGTGHVTADNFEALQQAVSAEPEAAQAVPVLIFMKGIARTEANHLVWDIDYRDGHFLVNGQDMSALAGPPPSDRKRPVRP